MKSDYLSGNTKCKKAPNFYLNKNSDEKKSKAIERYGGGSVGKVVASFTKGLRFESHQQRHSIKFVPIII